jgi:hypothetical protein
MMYGKLAVMEDPLDTFVLISYHTLKNWDNHYASLSFSQLFVIWQWRTVQEKF